MLTTLTHKIALDPTVAQLAYFSRAAGTARFVWNWALAEWNTQYRGGLKPNASGLKKQFNAIKYDLFPWLAGVHRDAHSQPFANLGKAFRAFFKGTARRPRFKSKRRSKDAFYVANDLLTISGRTVRLPLIGVVKMREELRFTGKIMSAVVSRTADRWFIAIAVEGDFRRSPPSANAPTVGVDVGVKNAAVLSTGEAIAAPKPLHKHLRRLRIRSRRLSRKVRGSKNRQRQARRVARIHARVANVRQDFWHKVSARLCRENQAVAVEDLNVAGMVQNRKLARALADVGFGCLRPMLTYKAALHGCTLTVAHRFYPSSRLCSACGVKRDGLTLSVREWVCAGCGAAHDRDVNAARNLDALHPTCPGNTVEIRSGRPGGLGPARPEVTPVSYDRP